MRLVDQKRAKKLAARKKPQTKGRIFVVVRKTANELAIARAIRRAHKAGGYLAGAVIDGEHVTFDPPQ